MICSTSVSKKIWESLARTDRMQKQMHSENREAAKKSRFTEMVCVHV